MKLNPPRTSLRPWRALLFLLFRTSVWTAMSLACGLYYVNGALRQAPGKPAAETAVEAKKPARRTPLKNPPEAPRSVGLEIADPLSLIKIPKAGPASKEGPERTKARPRLKAVTFAGSGGSFNTLERDEPEQAPESRAENTPHDEEAVLLPPAALSKKVKVKGARPVSAITGKKYSGVDPEAELLRERIRRQAEAAETAKAQLRHEKLLFAGWLALLALAAMLIPSRVIKAWRLIHKPEGSHWTLK